MATQKQSDYPGLARFFSSGGRVGVFGASGSGKTSFCEALAQRFSVSLKPEGVREWLIERNLTYGNLTPEQALELQRYCLYLCDGAIESVLDRTTLDALVYASWMAPDSGVDEFRRYTPRSLTKLDLLVFFPAYSAFLMGDGVRISDFKHQTEISAMMFIQARSLGLLHKVLVYDHSKTMETNIVHLDHAVRALAVGRI